VSQSQSIDGDEIEANRSGLDASISKVGVGGSGDPSRFTTVNGFFRSRRTRAALAHLNEDEDLAIKNDQVNFPAPG